MDLLEEGLTVGGVGVEDEDASPRWSDDGQMVYFASDRDGHACIYAQKIDRATGKPDGIPVGVVHLHNPRVSILHLPQNAFGLTVGGKRITFNQGELKSRLLKTQFTP